MTTESYEIKLQEFSQYNECTCCGAKVTTVTFRADDHYCSAGVCKECLKKAAVLIGLKVQD